MRTILFMGVVLVAILATYFITKKYIESKNSVSATVKSIEDTVQEVVPTVDIPHTVHTAATDTTTVVDTTTQSTSRKRK